MSANLCLSYSSLQPYGGEYIKQHLCHFFKSVPSITNKMVTIFKENAPKDASPKDTSIDLPKWSNDLYNIQADLANVDAAYIKRSSICGIIFNVVAIVAMIVAAIALHIIFPGVFPFIYSIVALILALLGGIAIGERVDSRKSFEDLEKACNAKLCQLEKFCNAHGLQTSKAMQEALTQAQEELRQMQSKKAEVPLYPVLSKTDQNLDSKKLTLKSKIEELQEAMTHLNNFMILINDVKAKKITG